jgi:hypothetical protein
VAKKSSNAAIPGVKWINVFQDEAGKQYLGMAWASRLSAVNSRHKGRMPLYRLRVILKQA